MAAIDSLLRAFALEATGPDRYRVEPRGGGSGVVFGGQLVGQTIVAGLAGHDGKTV
jgi:acyl-CoA thioesterase